MNKLKRDIKIFNLKYDLISLIVGVIIFIAMLIYGLLKVAYDIRGVTLIFGRGNNDPQWFAAMTFSFTILIGISMIMNVLFRNLLAKGKMLEIYVSSILSIFLFMIGIITLLSVVIMDEELFSSPKSIGIGAYASGVLFIIAGLLLFLRFFLEFIKIITIKFHKDKSIKKEKNITDLILEIEKLGTIIIGGIQISRNDKAIIDIINLYWNFVQMTNQFNISDSEMSKLNRENDRMLRYLKSLNLELNDYVNRVYNNMNLEILSVEVNNELKERTIIKTIEPEIRHNNIIIQRSKVLLAGPELNMED